MLIDFPEAKHEGGCANAGSARALFERRFLFVRSVEMHPELYQIPFDLDRKTSASTPIINHQLA
jgi:hypothetical protein